MAYRYYTYKMDWGYVTIDSQTEEEPQGYLDKFPVTEVDAVKIEAGADLETVDSSINIVSPMTDDDARAIINNELDIEEWRRNNPDAIAIGGSE